MAQSVNEIQDEVLNTIQQSADLPVVEVLTENEQSNLNNITSTSKVGVLRMLVFVFAVVSNHIQKLWDVFKIAIEELIASSRPFTERWYQETALAYQHGYSLEVNNEYATPTTAQEIEAANLAKVIKKAAVVQAVIAGVGALRLKVATETGGELAPVDAQVLAGFSEYMEQKGAAGVFVVATTNDADLLKLQYKIHFDPLILDNEGKRLDGNDDAPVQTAIKSYLKNSNSRDFNGKLSLAKLTDVVQAVPGVVDPHLVLAASKFGNYQYTDVTQDDSVGAIENYRQPDSGYLKLDEVESTFEFIPA